MDIKVEILQICGQAESFADGSVNATGIGSRFKVAGFPAIVGPFKILIRLRFQSVRGSTGTLVCSIVDTDGQLLLENTGQFNAPPNAETTGAVANVILGATVTFRRPGTHELRLNWNGEELASTPLYLELAPAESKPA